MQSVGPERAVFPVGLMAEGEILSDRIDLSLDVFSIGLRPELLLTKGERKGRDDRLKTTMAGESQV